MKMLFWLLLGLLTTARLSALDGTLIERHQGDTAARFGYFEYLPAGYAAAQAPQTTKRWPLVVFLHGAGRQGNGTTELSKNADIGPQRECASGTDFPAVILSPQAEKWFGTGTVDAFITYALGAYRIDISRMYLTGFSAGGKATWDYANVHAERLAAIVPVCGLWQENDPTHPLAAKNLLGLPVWAFHSFDDDVVPKSHSLRWMNGIAGASLPQRQVPDVLLNYPGASGERPAVATATVVPPGEWAWSEGAKAEPKNVLNLTLYANGGHDAWTRTYQDPAMWTWLFAQRRAAKK